MKLARHMLPPTLLCTPRATQTDALTQLTLALTASHRSKWLPLKPTAALHSHNCPTNAPARSESHLALVVAGIITVANHKLVNSCDLGRPLQARNAAQATHYTKRDCVSS